MAGSDPSWLTVRDRSMTEGRFITGHDVTTHAAVVVLGSTTAAELFGGAIRSARRSPSTGCPMTVIGVLNTVGRRVRRGFDRANQDDLAIVPITTAATAALRRHRRLGG